MLEYEEGRECAGVLLAMFALLYSIGASDAKGTPQTALYSRYEVA